MSEDIGTIHIFFGYLSLFGDETSCEFLSPEDRQRLALMRHQLRRSQFVAGRALLGTALADLFGPVARQWRLDAGTGSLRLQGDQAPQISLTHSHQIVACAIARQPIGLDVEYCRDRDFLALTEHICGPVEWQAFRALPPSERKSWFYERWILKEATYKLLGGDLYPELLVQDSRPCDGQTTGRYAVRDNSIQRILLPLPEGYMGAVVTSEEQPIRLEMHGCSLPS